MGGNAVVGYHQHFDIEGEFGVVVRGVGTAVTLETQRAAVNPFSVSPATSSSFSPVGSSPVSVSPVKFSFPHRSSSLDSDSGHNLPPGGSNPSHLRSTSNALENMEHPFFTLTSYPAEVLVHLGGVVSAHSVKLLDKIHNPDEPETRDVWWQELRQEIRSHATALRCNAVVGYKELTSICDELIILSAQGTAAVINPAFLSPLANPGNESVKDKLPTAPLSAAVVLDMTNPLDRLDPKKHSWVNTSPPRFFNNGPVNPQLSNISIFQVPYKADAPFPITLSPSPLDSSVQVPEVLFTTIDVPANVHVTGKGTVIQARFCRSKKKGQGESNAAAVGDILPFVEYELHKQLLNKLKLRGMNALFGLRVNISVGENLVIGIATGTAAYVTALPPASKPVLNCQNVKQGSSIIESIQAEYLAEIEKNKEHFNLLPPAITKENLSLEATMNSEFSLLNLSVESKQSLAVPIEDPDDAEQLRSMIDALPPKNCYVSNCQHVPGVPILVNNLQTFSMFWRVDYREGANDTTLNRGLRTICERSFSGLWARICRLSPALCLCGLRFNLIVPEDDEIHIWLTASAVEYKIPPVHEEHPKLSQDHQENELQFFMETEEKVRDGKPVHRGPQAEEGKLGIRGCGNESRPKGAEYATTNLRNQEYSNSDQSQNFGPGNVPGSLPVRQSLRLQIGTSLNESVGSSPSDKGSVPRIPSRHSSGGSYSSGGTASRHIEIVPMTYVPGCRVQRHIGFVNMFIIRETSAVRGGEESLPGTELRRGAGSNWFAHCVFVETQALLRAHVSALGGNALTSYRIEQCSLSESVAKNQAQCLIHVCGDAVVCVPHKFGTI